MEIEDVDHEEGTDPEQLDLNEQELATHIAILYDNGLGTDKIHDLVRLLYLADPDLAKHMEREFMYWSKHGSYDKGNV